MGTYEFMAIFENDSGLPEDRAINTFWGVFPTDSDAVSFGGYIGDFYDNDTGSGNAIRSYLSSALTGHLQVRIYDHGDTPPRVPVNILDRNLGALSSSTKLPNEVACCLSFRGDQTSGVNMARRRGRVFIGPLGINALLTTSSGDPTIEQDFADALLSGAEFLSDGAVVSNGTWVVYSRVDNATHQVVAAWVDNAPDTQRRRGRRPTSRSTTAV